jgi:hypothetical protein
MTPAALDTLLVGLNVDPGVRDGIIGDLVEERAEWASVHGERSADAWVRHQIVRSVPVLVAGAVREGGLRLLGAVVGPALAAMLAISLLIALSIALLSGLLTPDRLERLTTVLLAVDLAYGAAGGYLAARFGRTAPLGAAFVFGLLGVLVTHVASDDAHAGYRLALQLMLVPATVSGGWLRARSLARSTHPA